MGILEAGTAVIYGKIVEGFKTSFREDAYYDVVVIPGFSDGHAHPQVVDGGLKPGVTWRDSYDWIHGRDLVVDEVMIRRDLILASRLSYLTMARALLEGTTLIALTGRLAANVRAWLKLRGRPRAVFLPTVMDRSGWTLEEVMEDYSRARMFAGDGFTRIGIFVHSLGLASGETVLEALNLAARGDGMMGLHLGEGLSELELFKNIIGVPPYPAKIIPVHCIDDDVSTVSLHCVSCPSTNILLYNRTRENLVGISGFGSDWPLLLGTAPKHLPLIRKVFKEPLEVILRIATIGGYKLYDIPYDGDLVAYDGKLEDIIGGRANPKLVVVNNEISVYESTLVESQLTLDDIEKEIRKTIREASEKYGNGAPVKPPNPRGLAERYKIINSN